MSETNGNTQPPKKEKADLAVIGNVPLSGGLMPRTMDEAMQVAKLLADSLLLPQHLRGKPADVLVTMLKGLELGLKPMHAFAEIFVVNGRPGCSAALKRALVLQSPLCEYFRCAESTDKRATYVSKRRGGVETKTTYTIEQAQAAGLTKNETYVRHPAAMLRARASSGEADANWADVVQGIASLDELKEIEGQVITVKPNGPPLGQTVAPPAPKPSPPEASVVPDEPTDGDDFDWSATPKAEEKPPEPPKSNEMSELEKVLALISETTDGKQLESLVARIMTLPKEEQMQVRKVYTEKRNALAGAKAS